MTSNLIFVGDIHNQYRLLANLVDHYGKDTRFVFLGDINDCSIAPRSLPGTQSFLFSYFLLKDLVENYDSVLIKSNHQKNLINTLRGTRNKVSSGMRNILTELYNSDYLEYLIYQGDDNFIADIKATSKGLEMADWLDARPLFFRDEYEDVVGVHAEYRPDLSKGKMVQAALYGSREEETKERVKWWLEYDHYPFIVAGHYHTESLSKNCAIIDGCCGEPHGRLLALEFDTKIIRSFV
jgi:Calcineurin-like phosphoesterase